MRRRFARGRRALLAALVVLSLSVCTNGDKGQDARGGAESFSYPARADAIAGPGSPLLDGFVVEKGSWLLGAPFPHLSRIVDPAIADDTGEVFYGWEAVLALTGNQRTVAKGYLAQARKLGFTEGGEFRCGEDGRCEGARYVPSPGLPPQGRSFDVEAVRNDRTLGGAKTALVRLSVSDEAKQTPRVVRFGQDEPAIPSVDPLAKVPTIPKGDLPGVGERFGGVQFELKGRRVGEKVSFTVEKGSQLVTPALLDPREDLLGESMIAILRFDENAGATLASYVRQATEHYSGDPHRGPHHETWELDQGVQVTQYATSCPGGCGNFELTAVRWIDDVTYALLRASTRS